MATLTMVFVNTETKRALIITARRSRVLIVFRSPSVALFCSEISPLLEAAYCSTSYTEKGGSLIVGRMLKKIRYT